MNQCIGQGAYGEVSKAVHRLSKIECAVKIISKEKANATKYKSLQMKSEL